MKSVAVALMLVACVLTGSKTSAQRLNADDVKWINQCIDDNKGEASATVIRKYCSCMNEKMGDNETRSITQWEKSHPRERAVCDKESGWK